ncbi:hypothetical protein J3E74DRAFT_291512 [Bipolaris maydis]|nr:hypothetical protein J3E74DRAFT_291512 [Bipolaris maydis]
MFRALVVVSHVCLRSGDAAVRFAGLPSGITRVDRALAAPFQTPAARQQILISVTLPAPHSPAWPSKIQIVTDTRFVTTAGHPLTTLSAPRVPSSREPVPIFYSSTQQGRTMSAQTHYATVNR